MAKTIAGINTVIAGVFKDNGDLDEESLANLIDHLIKIKCHGITMFGIATEFHKLSDDERNIMAYMLAQKTKASDTFSVMSVTDHSADVAVKRAKYYESLGTDALMVLPPFFLNPSIEQIKEHIFAILEAVNIPVLIQYAPGETKKLIAVEEMAQIKAKYSNAIFKLEPNPPMDYVNAMLKLAPDAQILIGYAGLYMMEVLKVGGKGTMPGCSFAEIYLKINELFNAQKLDEATALHEKLMQYVRIWMTNPEFIIAVEKYILKQRGIIKSDYCRRPFYALSNEEKQKCDCFLEEFASFLN